MNTRAIGTRKSRTGQIFLSLALLVTGGLAAASPPADELAAGSLKGARSVHGEPVHMGAHSQVLTENMWD